MKNFAFTVALLILGASTAAHAQVQSYEPETEIEPKRPMRPQKVETTTPSVAPEDAMSVHAVVRHGARERPVANAPVFLRAARPKGPFEPRDPTPVHEWAGFTDAEGHATFDRVPKDLSSKGLRLHATTTHGGVAFKSPASAPAPGVRLEIQVYEKSLDVSGVAISRLRNIVEPWEDYLVFTQYYTLTNRADTVLDVSLLPDDEYERGLPITLPVKAQGIKAMGRGESKVVNSTVYWKGVLRPGESVPLQIRFSMSAKTPTFEYEQTMGYPTDDVEIVFPVQTNYEKLPRLNDLELRAPGFSETKAGPGVFGLRDDVAFVGARGLELDEGEPFRFQLRGLPFEPPITPWFFLGFGVLAAAGVLVYSRRERQSTDETKTSRVLAELEAQKEALFAELVALEKASRNGQVTRREYEEQSLSLRERLALVMKKIEDARAESEAG